MAPKGLPKHPSNRFYPPVMLKPYLCSTYSILEVLHTSYRNFERDARKIFEIWTCQVLRFLENWPKSFASRKKKCIHYCLPKSAKSAYHFGSNFGTLRNFNTLRISQKCCFCSTLNISQRSPHVNMPMSSKQCCGI